MSYNAQKIIDYAERIYSKVQDTIQRSVDLVSPSGLEMALVSVGNDFVGNKNLQNKYFAEKGKKALDGYLLSHTLREFYEKDGKVVVVRDDLKQTVLNPASVLHSEESYVNKKLCDDGMCLTSALVKKIAKPLKILRKKLYFKK